MREKLAEMKYFLLDCLLQEQVNGLSLFVEFLLVKWVRHDVVEILNRDGGKVEDFDNLDLLLHCVGRGPVADHAVHDLPGILIKEHPQQIDNIGLHTLLGLVSAQHLIQLLIESMELLELKLWQPLEWDLVLGDQFWWGPACCHCQQQLLQLVWHWFWYLLGVSFAPAWVYLLLLYFQAHVRFPCVQAEHSWVWLGLILLFLEWLNRQVQKIGEQLGDSAKEYQNLGISLGYFYVLVLAGLQLMRMD